MLQTWFKIFYRNSKKNWLNIAINIAGLTLGLAGLLLVLLFLNDEKDYNQWNPYKDEIYRVVHQRAEGTMQVSTAMEGPVYKERNPEVLDYLMVQGRYSEDVVKYENKPHFFDKIVVSDKNFFEFFPFQFLSGTPKTFAENLNNAAISTEVAEQMFGATDVLGKVVYMDDLILTITGVFKSEDHSFFEPQIVIQFPERMDNSSWSNFSFELFCKFSKNPDIAAAEKLMNDVYVEFRDQPAADEKGISLELFQEKYMSFDNKLEQLSTIRLHHLADEVGPEGAGNYQLLMVLLSLAVLLLVISCVNIINLSTASASQRAKEVGVKKTIGFSKQLLIGHSVMEVVLQAILSILFAFILVELVLPYFNDFLGKSLSVFDGSALITVILVALIISILIGLIPALYLSNFKAIEVLKGNFSRSKKGVLIRNAMLGLQFLISGFFLIGVLVIYAQIDFMMSKDTGFNGEQIVVVNLTERENKFQKYELAKQILPQHPNIVSVNASLFVPGKSFVNGSSMSYKDITNSVATNFIDFDYVDFAQLNILEGRAFDKKFASDTINSLILNETAAKQFGFSNKEAIDKKMKLLWGPDGEELNVIGIIQDIHIGGFDQPIYPMMIANWGTFNNPKNWMRDIQIKIKPENVAETMAYIETYWSENVEQGYPFKYEFLDTQFAKTYEKYKQQQTMFLILSFIVIIIALLGLFALATLTIQQRLKEVAIRKTLGASVKEIVVQLVKSFLKLSIMASVLLLPIAYYFMQNWLDNFIFKIDMPVWPYIVTPIILLVLVFTVVGLKAYNATKIDLIKYLKFE